MSIAKTKIKIKFKGSSMKKNIFLLSILSMSAILCASDYDNLTYLVRKEMATHNNPNLSLETHPTVYSMVRELAEKANVTMPKYITLYGAEYDMVARYGTVHRNVHEIKAHVDILGDLYICREILTILPYQDIEGIVAIAMAEKAINQPAKLAVTGVTTFGLTVTAVYLLNKYRKLGIGSFFNSGNCDQDLENRIVLAFLALITPALLTTKIHANNLQKTIDLDATELTDSQNVINGIKGLSKITDTYVKENVFSRIATALDLKKIYNTLFYPVRAFTSEERIAYLEQEAGFYL